MKDLDIPAVEAALEGTIFSGKLRHLQSLDSTNRLAKDLAAGGAPEGTVVLAEKQTSGRGRMGRSWLSAKGSSLTFSVLLRPGLTPDRVFTLTMTLALAAASGIQETAGVSPGLKWPNDLYLGGGKIGGILTEFSVREDLVAYAILGLGLNVSWHPWEGSSAREATSISAEAGRRVNRADLLVSLLRNLHAYYEDIMNGRVSRYVARWNELSIVLGRSVRVETDSGIVNGIAEGIDACGALVVRDETGAERLILCGDVSLRM